MTIVVLFQMVCHTIFKYLFSKLHLFLFS